jgi:hypothetical protein
MDSCVSVNANPLGRFSMNSYDISRFSKIAIWPVLLTIFVGCVGITGATQNRPAGLNRNDNGVIRDGIRNRWYPSGAKAEAVTLKNGRKTGPYIAWYENGQMKLKSRFHDDALDGDVEAWFEDGRKRFTVSFVNGLRQGRWTRYHEKRDQIVASIGFSHDRLDGFLSTAFEQGNGNGSGRSYRIHSVFREGALVDSFHLVHTNTSGHTVIAIGQRSENGAVTFDKQKNVTMTADGSLIIDDGHGEKKYASLQDFFVAEINRHVVTKFSLDFCDSPENLWPCRFPKNTI